MATPIREIVFDRNSNQYKKEYWKAVSLALKTHFDGCYPEKIEKSFPNESDESAETRKRLYEPITMPEFKEALSKVLRAIESSAITYTSNKELDDLVVKYDVFRELLNKWSYSLSIDPNSIIVVYPIGYEKVIDNIPHYRIVSMADDKLVYETKNGYHELDSLRLYVYTLKSGSEYELDIYEHGLGFVPIVRPMTERYCANGVYISPFTNILPYANILAIKFSQSVSVDMIHAFPIKEEMAMQCDEAGCMNGKVGESECTKCGGSGVISIPTSPFRAIQKMVYSNMSSYDNAHLQVPSVRFISPETSIIEYANKSWQEILTILQKKLHIYKVDSRDSKSADSIIEDRKDKWEWYYSINSIFISRFEQVLNILNKMLGYADTINIAVPESYDIVSSQEAIALIASAINDNTPEMFRKAQIDGVFNRYISKSSAYYNYYQAIQQIDPLYFKTPKEIEDAIQRSILSETDKKKHFYIPSVMNNLLQNNREAFEDLPIDALIKLVTEKYKSLYE